MKNLFLLGMFALILASCSKKNEIKDLPTEGAKAGSKLRVSALANYYVNGATGNDANAGTSAATALKTIQAALYKTPNGVGANIYVATGL
jgi:hypothetical protein